MRDRRAALLWAALGGALSAPLVDLARHVVATPPARGTLLFLPLFAYAAWTDPRRAPPASDGIVWLALGLALSLLAVAGGMTRVGRPGVAIAVIGMARLLGHPSLSCAALAAWIVPVPAGLESALGPGLAGWIASAAQALGARAGVPVGLDTARIAQLVLDVPSGHLDLVPGDGGLAVAWTLAGIGWFAALRRDATAATAVASALGWAAAGIGVQALALAIACGVAIGGHAHAARVLLDQTGLVAAVTGLLIVVTVQPRAHVAAEPHPAGATR